MTNLLKAGALVIYLLAVVGMFVELPFGATNTVQLIAAILIGAHVLEVLIAFKHIKRYRGPLIDSIALTILFGFLHWSPLKQR